MGLASVAHPARSAPFDSAHSSVPLPRYAVIAAWDYERDRRIAPHEAVETLVSRYNELRKLVQQLAGLTPARESPLGEYNHREALGTQQRWVAMARERIASAERRAEIAERRATEAEGRRTVARGASDNPIELAS